MSKPHLVLGNKNYSSWSFRPWLAMKATGIDFTEEVVRLDRPDTKARIAEHSRAGRVPILKHDGVIVWESLAITAAIIPAPSMPASHAGAKRSSSSSMTSSAAIFARSSCRRCC